MHGMSFICILEAHEIFEIGWKNWWLACYNCRVRANNEVRNKSKGNKIFQQSSSKYVYLIFPLLLSVKTAVRPQSPLGQKNKLESPGFNVRVRRQNHIALSLMCHFLSPPSSSLRQPTFFGSWQLQGCWGCDVNDSQRVTPVANL